MKKLITILVMLVAMSASGQWVNVPNGLNNNTPVWSLTSSGNNIFAGTGLGVYITTNDGLNWTKTNLNPAQSANTLLADGNNIYAGTTNNGNGVYITSNNGQNWSVMGTDNVPWVFALAKYGDTLFAGSSGALGIYRTTNNGLNWTRFLIGKYISSLMIKDNIIYAGDWQQPIVWRSTNNGLNWDISNLGGQFPRVVLSLTAKGNKIFAGTDNDGVFVTSNNGANWIQTSLSNASINCFAINGNNIFAGELFYQKGVYLSTNDGVNWIHKNQGMVGERIWSLTTNNQYIFAGTDNSVWRRSITEIVGVENIGTEVPSAYSLKQNFPNPFNPNTVISFQLSVVSDVVMKVYDINGREVRTLVNEKMNAGTYEVDFDGSELNSGVYIYQMRAGNFSEAKRMVLLK